MALVKAPDHFVAPALHVMETVRDHMTTLETLVTSVLRGADKAQLEPLREASRAGVPKILAAAAALPADKDAFRFLAAFVKGMHHELNLTTSLLLVDDLDVELANDTLATIVSLRSQCEAGIRTWQLHDILPMRVEKKAEAHRPELV